MPEYLPFELNFLKHIKNTVTKNEFEEIKLFI